jgi:hypothetical protein
LDGIILHLEVDWIESLDPNFTRPINANRRSGIFNITAHVPGRRNIFHKKPASCRDATAIIGKDRIFKLPDFPWIADSKISNFQ